MNAAIAVACASPAPRPHAKLHQESADPPRPASLEADKQSASSVWIDQGQERGATLRRPMVAPHLDGAGLRANPGSPVRAREPRLCGLAGLPLSELLPLEAPLRCVLWRGFALSAPQSPFPSLVGSTPHFTRRRLRRRKGGGRSFLGQCAELCRCQRRHPWRPPTCPCRPAIGYVARAACPQPRPS
jgi:hypothetical protein